MRTRSENANTYETERTDVEQTQETTYKTKTENRQQTDLQHRSPLMFTALLNVIMNTH